MPQWICVIAVSLLLSSGCATPRAKGSLLRANDEPTKTASPEVAGSQTATPVSSTTPVSQPSGPQLRNNSSAATPASTATNQPTPKPLATSLESPSNNSNAWNEIEQAIASEPSKLTPQMQHYLRDQVLAVLAAHDASQSTVANQATQLQPSSSPSPSASQPAASVPPLALPGPDPNGLAPVIDEATYRRLVPTKSVSLDAIPRSDSTDAVRPASYLEKDFDKPRVEEKPVDGTSDAARNDEANKKNAAAPATKRELPPENWRASLTETLKLLDDELRNLPEKDSEASTIAVYTRLLHAIANHRDEAVAAIEQLPNEEQEYWKHQLYALMLAIDADGKHTSNRRAALVLRELREAVDRLANVSTLDVRHLALCKSVDSYGCFTEFPTNSFKAGDEVVLYVEVDNFSVEKVQDKYETELSWTYDIFDENKKRVANVVLPIDKNRCENRRRDYFIAPKVFLPKELRPGPYTLRVSVEDMKGGKSNEGSLEFRIR